MHLITITLKNHQLTKNKTKLDVFYKFSFFYNSDFLCFTTFCSNKFVISCNLKQIYDSLESNFIKFKNMFFRNLIKVYCFNYQKLIELLTIILVPTMFICSFYQTARIICIISLCIVQELFIAEYNTSNWIFTFSKVCC